MKRLWKILAFTLFLLALLAACQPAVGPAPIQTETGGQTYPYPAAQPQTEPGQTGQTGAYPAPIRDIEYVPYNPYPSPVAGDRVEWSQVAELLQSGEILDVLQTRSLQIVLTTKDGRLLLAQAPAVNDIFNLIAQCGEPCAAIRQRAE